MLRLWLAENGGTTLTGIVEKLDEIRERVAAQSARFPIVAKARSSCRIPIEEVSSVGVMPSRGKDG